MQQHNDISAEIHTVFYLNIFFKKHNGQLLWNHLYYVLCIVCLSVFPRPWLSHHQAEFLSATGWNILKLGYKRPEERQWQGPLFLC